ncbi:hypothetical protein PV327_003548 [Microctonus hyperodae]|uniref:Small ribosomal subunit protein uS15m n=1 Tax=Microctonus hyperodae TaxID=165561 RepID=A0AA39G5U3_MICHY|nr:hypothetical protein PV327_003548 [Microctonus hyperodae]
MNTLLNNLRNTPFVINSLLKNSSMSIARGFKSDLKIKWIRPQKCSAISPEKSGDGGITYDLKETDLLPMFEKCKELEDADEFVKKMFTFEFNHISEIVQRKKDIATDLVKQHQFDTKSFEVSMAKMTTHILCLQEYMERHPRNGHYKNILKELIDRRKKLLSKLRKWDYKKFEWLLEKLNLTFKPFVPFDQVRIERKASMRKLTAKHCDKLKQDKLDAYKAQLESEKKSFYKEKFEQLQFIRNEEIACGVPPTVTEEEIEIARKQAAQYQ